MKFLPTHAVSSFRFTMNRGGLPCICLKIAGSVQFCLTVDRDENTSDYSSYKGCFYPLKTITKVLCRESCKLHRFIMD